jgi:hypothetical protein
MGRDQNLRIVKYRSLIAAGLDRPLLTNLIYMRIAFGSAPPLSLHHRMYWKPPRSSDSASALSMSSEDT